MNAAIYSSQLVLGFPGKRKKESGKKRKRLELDAILASPAQEEYTKKQKGMQSREQSSQDSRGREERMDYSLAALKLLCGQLKDARQIPSQSSLTLGSILFQRAWLQGILVSDLGDGRLLLDDGTGVIELALSGDFRLRRWDVGMYVMVVGGYFPRTGQTSLIKVHKMVDLSAFPDREAMWYLEVMEAYKLFYHQLVEDFL